MGNPIVDDFPELVTLDSRNCVLHRWWLHCVPWKKQASNSIKTLYKMFWKNAFNLFIILPRRTFLLSSKDTHPKETSNVLQNNVALFGQLYILMQSRDGDLKEFFAHELQSFPLFSLRLWQAPFTKHKI